MEARQKAAGVESSSRRPAGEQGTQHSSVQPYLVRWGSLRSQLRSLRCWGPPLGKGLVEPNSNMALAAWRREGETRLSLCYLPFLLTLPFPRRCSPHPTHIPLLTLTKNCCLRQRYWANWQKVWNCTTSGNSEQTGPRDRDVGWRQA